MSDIELTTGNTSESQTPVDSDKPESILIRPNDGNNYAQAFAVNPRLQHRRRSVSSALSHHASIQSAASLASIDRPPSRTSSPTPSHQKLPPSKVYHPLSPHVIALLMPASIFGVLARLGIQALTDYEGRSVFPLAWVQFMGCFIMGFCVGIKEPLGQFYGPLYTAFTTGFCGSLTTFSGWQFDVFESWLNVNGDHRDWLRDVVDGLTKTFFTLALSLSAVQFGSYLASLLRHNYPSPLHIPPPSRTARYALSALSVLIYAAAYPAYFRLPATFRHQATAALLFSFPGTLTRYLLSLSLNPRLDLLPLGTFTANIFGSALLGSFHVLQGLENPLSSNACAILQGLADGYCGCLTTVSTFAVEVATLETRKGWLYVGLSWVCAQLTLLVILGPSYWAGGVNEGVTCTFIS